MLDVFYTVDVELWCNGWRDLDARFEDAFARCIHGRTASGDYGVAFQAQRLHEHGLHGVFFVEPLFAARFGLAPLRAIVAAIASAGQEIQLHLHTEWACEAREQWIHDQARRRQNLSEFSGNDQARLIAAGRDLLLAAGASGITAFRAGNFGADTETLAALERLGFAVDSSVNARHAQRWPSLPGPPDEPFRFGALTELPMTVFDDGSRAVRQVALTAVSIAELEGLLWQALETGRRSFVILAHGFELLDASRRRRDDTVLRRFDWLCAFLARHRDLFRTARMADAPALASGPAPTGPAARLCSPRRRTVHRCLEQGLRRVAGGIRWLPG